MISELRLYFQSNQHSFLARTSVIKMLHYYPQWKKFQSPDRSPITEERPWINFQAFDLLKSLVKPEMSVFEYGMGGSTIYFARNVREVISVEHNEHWFNTVVGVLESSRIRNVRPFLQVPERIGTSNSVSVDYSDPALYLSSDEKFLTHYSFYNYASMIDRFPRDYFDMILVDGRARPSCIFHSVKHLKQGGYLILDNSDRHHYYTKLRETFNQVSLIQGFFGPGPFERVFWGTSIYVK